MTSAIRHMIFWPLATLIVAFAWLVSGPEPDGPNVFERTADAVVRLDINGVFTCSGFYIGNSLIVTANHCVVNQPKDKWTVVWQGGQETQGVTLWSDNPGSTWPITSADMAVIYTPDAPDVEPIDVACREPRFGEPVYVFGWPLETKYGLFMTSGVVSMDTSDEHWDDGNMIFWSDAPSEKGMSGGPMIDAEGNAIGLVSHGVPRPIQVPYGLGPLNEESSINGYASLAYFCDAYLTLPVMDFRAKPESHKDSQPSAPEMIFPGTVYGTEIV